MKAARIAVIGALIAAGGSQARAASTNIVQDLRFTLTAYEQGATNQPTTNVTVISAEKFKITTADVIGVIGNALGKTFDPTARLVHITHVNATTNVEAWEIRDGTNGPVDVTSYFEGTHRSDLVKSSVFNDSTGILSGTTYSLFHLEVANVDPAGLKADGFATTVHASIISSGHVLGVDQITANLAGSGTDTNGVPFVANGVMLMTGHTVEVK